MSYDGLHKHHPNLMAKKRAGFIELGRLVYLLITELNFQLATGTLAYDCT